MERDIFIYICRISPIQTYNNENILCTNDKIMTFLKDSALCPHIHNYYLFDRVGAYTLPHDLSSCDVEMSFVAYLAHNSKI